MQSALEITWKLVGELGGFAVVVGGLSAWLGRIWAEKILEKDRQHYRGELERLKSTYESANKSLQAELDKAIHIHRVQFETEFKALSEIWVKITELRSEMAALRPIVDRDVVGEDPMEKYRRRLVQFSKSLAELKSVVFKYAPFYSQEIYDLLWELVRFAGFEEFTIARACQSGTFPGANWLAEGNERLEEMVRKGNAISDSIRQRLQKLSLYPD